VAAQCARPESGPQRGCAAKNCQMTRVAFRAVDGGSVCRSRWASRSGAAPGHWWPAPAMVISSTVRPAGQSAVEVVTTPAVVMTGAAQWSMRLPRRGLAQRGHGRALAGVVDEHVQVAEPLGGRPGRCPAGLGLGDVGLHDQRGPAQAADLAAGRLQPVPPAGRQHHVGPGLGQGHREARAEAAAGPGDQCHLPGQREPAEHRHVGICHGTDHRSTREAPARRGRCRRPGVMTGPFGMKDFLTERIRRVSRPGDLTQSARRTFSWYEQFGKETR